MDQFQQFTSKHFIYQCQNILYSIFLENITQNTNKHANIRGTILPHKEQACTFNTNRQQTWESQIESTSNQNRNQIKFKSSAQQLTNYDLLLLSQKKN